MQIQEEQRAKKRQRVRWKTRWQVLGQDERSARILDISPTGAFLADPNMADNIHVGMRVQLDTRLPRSPLRLNSGGIVRWVGVSSKHECEGIGIEFDSSQGVIRKYWARPKRPKLKPIRPRLKAISVRPISDDEPA